jgi:hypothetical protein
LELSVWDVTGVCSWSGVILDGKLKGAVKSSGKGESG